MWEACLPRKPRICVIKYKGPADCVSVLWITNLKSASTQLNSINRISYNWSIGGRRQNWFWNRLKLELSVLYSSISFHLPKRRAHKAHSFSVLSCNFTRRTLFHFHCNTLHPTITGFLSSHQTLPIVLGTQLLNFKVLSPPSASSSSSFVFPTVHFVLLPVFSEKLLGCFQPCRKCWR